MVTFRIPVADILLDLIYVYTLEARDRDKFAVFFWVIASQSKEGLECIANFIEAILTPPHCLIVHLVDNYNKLGYS